MTKYPSFTNPEHLARLAAARKALSDNGLDMCISIAPETHYYLAGYDSWVGVNSPQALIFSVDASVAPTLIVRNTDRFLAWETSWVEDIRDYQLFAQPFAELVTNICLEHGQIGGRVAMELGSYALNASLYRQLVDALAPATIVDATNLLGNLRTIKSPAEMGHIRKAAEYACVGLDAGRNALVPGVTEIELAGEIEHAMRQAGSEYWAIPTEIGSGFRTPGGHATPADKVIAEGDIVHMEFAGVCRRYHAVAVHTMSCKYADPRALELYELARASLAAGIVACKVGAPVHDVEEASLTPVRIAGLEYCATMRFGYGIGIAYPPVWLETLQISRGFDTILKSGMVFVLHAYLQVERENLGIIQGGTWALTDQGLEQLVGGGDIALDVV